VYSICGLECGYAFFIGQCGLPGARVLCKRRASPCSKFIVWLVLLECCWTSDRLQRHSLLNSGSCALCCQHAETIGHLLLSCAYAREIWLKLLHPPVFQLLTPTQDASLADWWLPSRKQVPKGLPVRLRHSCLLGLREYME
jgi:hypothetical protein